MSALYVVRHATRIMSDGKGLRASLPGTFEQAKPWAKTNIALALFRVNPDGSEERACWDCGIATGDEFSVCDSCLRDYEAKLAGFESLEAESAWYALMADECPDDGPSDADPGL